jgi:hypothetical protein
MWRVKTLLLAGLLLTSSTLFAADVTGTWRGTLSINRADGTVRNISGMAVFKQVGAEVTGWMGDNENDQNTISKGTIQNDKINITITTRGGDTLVFDLTVQGDQITGTGRRGNGETARIQFKKSTP